MRCFCDVVVRGCRRRSPLKTPGSRWGRLCTGHATGRGVNGRERGLWVGHGAQAAAAVMACVRTCSFMFAVAVLQRGGQEVA